MQDADLPRFFMSAFWYFEKFNVYKVQFLN